MCLVKLQHTKLDILDIIRWTNGCKMFIFTIINLEMTKSSWYTAKHVCHSVEVQNLTWHGENSLKQLGEPFWGKTTKILQPDFTWWFQLSYWYYMCYMFPAVKTAAQFQNVCEVFIHVTLIGLIRIRGTFLLHFDWIFNYFLSFSIIICYRSCEVSTSWLLYFGN